MPKTAGGKNRLSITHLFFFAIIFDLEIQIAQIS